MPTNTPRPCDRSSCDGSQETEQAEATDSQTEEQRNRGRTENTVRRAMPRHRMVVLLRSFLRFSVSPFVNPRSLRKLRYLYTRGTLRCHVIRVALIGYGYAGRTFHAPLIRATHGLELVLVNSRNAQQVHADLPDVAVVSSATDVYVNPSVDLVVIATPNDTHVAIATAAIRAGKHVVVEKPFAPTLGEARDLMALAHRTGRVLAVFHNRRWDGDFLALRDLISRSVLGNVTHS